MKPAEVRAALLKGCQKATKAEVTVEIRHVEAALGQKAGDVISTASKKSKSHVCLNRLALIEALGAPAAAPAG